MNISKTFLEKLPIIDYDKENGECLNKIVHYTIISKRNDEISISDFWERLIDAIVYELYFPDEIKAADAELLKHLTNLPALQDGWSDELAVIQKVYREISNPSHPVAIAMEKMKTVPEVRIIEGLDK